MQKQEQVHRILEGDSIKRRGFFEAILVLLFLLTVMAFFLSVCVGCLLYTSTTILQLAWLSLTARPIIQR